MDHLDMAVYDIVHNSELPAKAIASRIGTNHQVLINKANPQCETHKLTLREAISIQLITGRSNILRAMQTELGIAKDESPKESLLEALLVASGEHGDVVNCIKDALADGRFTPREREQCQQEIDEAISALTRLRQRVVTEEVC